MPADGEAGLQLHVRAAVAGHPLCLCQGRYISRRCPPGLCLAHACASPAIIVTLACMHGCLLIDRRACRNWLPAAHMEI